jgi:hypothetical protein
LVLRKGVSPVSDAEKVLAKYDLRGQNVLRVGSPNGVEKYLLGIPPEGIEVSLHRLLPFGSKASLFHGYALGQISWLVHIRSLENGYIISQKL